MPAKKAVKKSKAEQDAETLKEIQALKRALGIDKHSIDTPGAGDQELYPTDRGNVEFRLAKGKPKKKKSTGSGGYYA